MSVCSCCLPAECLACRAPAIVDVGLAQLALADEAWTCPRVLEEALSVGQDPDCRGQARQTPSPEPKLITPCICVKWVVCL